MRMRLRAAFTLIELLAALALSGLAIVGAARLLDQLADTRERSAALARSVTQSANGIRLLRALVYRADMPDARFSGTDTAAGFQSWCEVPEGWLERCIVALRITAERDSAELIASVRGTSLTLWRGRGPAEFRYFSGIPAPGGGQWLSGWGTSVAPPAAIGIVTARDTIALRVGSGT